MKINHQHILTINSGSSSIKFALYAADENLKKIFSGEIKRIGLSNPEFRVTNPITNEKNEILINATNFKGAAEVLVEWLKKQTSFGQVSYIGHRIVHGMEHTRPEMIDEKLIEELRAISKYDPDHLPAEIELIELFKKQFPEINQFACFDTSFHTGMPRVAKILPIPRRFINAGIQRYGFHGLSYTYLMEALKNKEGSQKSEGRIILAHLGNGASLAAVKDGKSLDTTMGFTPAGGLVMSARPGDLDPGIIWYLVQNEKLSAGQLSHLINHECGLLGVSGTTSDMQDLLQKENEDARAAEAVDLFCYSIKKWIGAYAAVLNGLDTLVFSGGIGENAPVIRSRICQGFDYLDMEIDEVKNKKNATIISTVKSKVSVYVIPIDEEIIIAKSGMELMKQA